MLQLPLPESLGPEWSLIVIVGWSFYQFYAPKFGVETTLSPMLDVPKRLGNVEQSTKDLSQKVEAIDDKQIHHIQATRANARALDPEKSVTVDSEDIDEYLVENGVPVAVFLSPPTDGSESTADAEHATAESEGHA